MAAAQRRWYCAGNAFIPAAWQNEGEVAAFIGGEGESLAVPEEALRAILDRLFGTASDEPDWQKIRRRGGGYAAYRGDFRRAGHQ